MIRGFEDITAPLNEEEVEIKKAVVNILKRAVGKDKALSNSAIRGELKKMDIGIGGERVRKIVNAIRRDGDTPILCSCSKGYFRARDEMEVIDYITSLNQRIMSIQAVLNETIQQYEQRKK